jgi:hypothetical protein
VIEISGLQALIALCFVILGPASGVWSGLLIKNLTQRIGEDRDDTRSWLKGLQAKMEENTKNIAEVIAVMKDRQER